MSKNSEFLYNINYKENYKKEIKEIYNHINQKHKDKKIAENYIIKIMEKIRILEIFPFAHKLLSKTKNFEYRKLIVKNYIIIYKINLKEKKVYILHIYNQKVNWRTRIPLNQYK